MCGITGIKPTYGLCSRFGMIAYASSLDQAGAMARSAWDCALVLGAMAGFDPRDATSVEHPSQDYTAALDAPREGADAARPLNGLRIGLPREWFAQGLADDVGDAVREALAELAKLGADLVEVSLPRTELAIPAYYIVAPAECSSNLARYDGVRYGLRVDGKDITDMYEKTRAAGFGAEVRRRVLIGTYVLSAGYYDAYYLKAQQVRTLIARDFTEAYKKCDVLLTPTAPSAAFGIGEKTADPLAMYAADVNTVTLNLAGLPGIAVPAGLSGEGLPLGLQLIGKTFDEETLFRAAYALEEAAQFKAEPAAWWRA
jgi:aspartyl-tRNA(Asn)/glutamyl-tRNA(Gln) amidotransferase subunit A